MDELRNLLVKAEKVELLGAQIYRFLATGFPDGSTAWNTYRTLAAEEDEHASRIRELADRIESRPYPAHLTVDHASLDQLVAEAQALLRMLEESGPSLAAEEARRFIMELERRFGSVHAHALVTGDPELESFFAELAFQDQTHLEVLQRLAGAK